MSDTQTPGPRPTSPGHGTGTSTAPAQLHSAAAAIPSGVPGTAGSATGAVLTHGTWGAIKRHRRDRQPLCDDCATFQRDYNRDYYRAARNVEPFRQRHNAAHRESSRRRMADPKRHAQFIAWQRNYRAELRRRDAADRRHGIDPVVVERLVDGEPVDANRAERLEAFRQLLDRGHALNDAARRLGINGKYARKYAADTTTRKEGAA